MCQYPNINRKLARNDNYKYEKSFYYLPTPRQKLSPNNTQRLVPNNLSVYHSSIPLIVISSGIKTKCLL